MALSLGELAQRLGAELHGDPTVAVERIAGLENATSGAVSFLANRRYHKNLAGTKASAVILAPRDLSACPVAALVSENPYLGYARAAALLNPAAEIRGGVHPTAWISPQAHVDASAWIGAQGVVGDGAHIGPKVFVGPGCVVGEGVTIGPGSKLVASVTVCHGVKIGRRALIHPGAVIGGDGFGIANDNGVWVKIPQLGSVNIGDDVEIGANTSIDRGALEDTIIEDGVKIDNQVQVGHNVRIGAHTAIAGCVGIAGSARIGSRCTIGGAANIGGHLEIVDDVHITGASTLPNSLKEPGVYSSTMPVQENRAWRRNVARIRQLDDLARRLKTLEDRS